MRLLRLRRIFLVVLAVFPERRRVVVAVGE